jgi:uncharacterized membrane protein
MAIEIRVPEGEVVNPEHLAGALLHLMPVLLAYAVSFIFIGAIWYQHLKIFSVLRDYDKGLIIRNLALLFFIGLFPFSASLMSHARGQVVPLTVYMGVIFCCIITQYILYHYVVVKRPELRLNVDVTVHLEELRKRRIAIGGFSLASTLVVLSYLLITDPAVKSYSFMWMAAFPVVYRILTRRKTASHTAPGT